MPRVLEQSEAHEFDSLLEAADMTASEFARLLGTSPNKFSRWRSGKHTPPPEVRLFMAALTKVGGHRDLRRLLENTAQEVLSPRESKPADEKVPF